LETILVTGGAGFIGSHLCDKLLGRGHRVVCLDNLSTGSLRNVAHLQNDPRFTCLEADLCETLVPGERFDRVFHLASPASPVAYDRMPVETAMVNALGTYNVLELAREQSSSVLVTSTSEIYGDPLIHPQPEEYWGNVNSIGPRSPYDEGKRFAEALAITYFREFGVDVRITRIFNTFGPRFDPDDGRIIPNFIGQALANEPITIYGTGEQTRSLCYVDDLVEGLLLTMYTPAARGEVVNLGCPDERTVLNIATRIRDAIGSRSEIVTGPARPEEPARRRPNIEKARALLGWEPSTDLQRGLKLTIEWFRGQLLEAQAAAGTERART